MEVDILKVQFLGSVEYAAHFARLRPLLYSADGLAWDGIAKREWFPEEGLLFSVAADLKYAHVGSLWVFRAIPNSRSGDGPDRFSISQLRPAALLRTDLAPMDTEAARRLATSDGIEAPAGTKVLGLPELDDQWVVTPELERQTDGLWRVAPGAALKRVKAYRGSAESLCGMATPEGQYALPPISPSAALTRNWLDPIPFISELAKDLSKWIPHGPHKERARLAAQAMRDLAPHLAELSALKSPDAQAAVARAVSLSSDAEDLISSADEIAEILTSTTPFKERIAGEQTKIRSEMEELALAEAQAMAGELHAKMVKDSDHLKEDIAASERKLAELQNELKELEVLAKKARAEKDSKLGGLEAEFEAIMRRVSTKPAKALMEWAAASGLRLDLAPSSSASTQAPGDIPLVISKTMHPPIDGMDLARGLRTAAARDDKASREMLEWMDIGIRARELPVLVGPTARHFAEAWLSICTMDNVDVVVADPTLLSLRDLMPSGARGALAPLAKVFQWCTANPDRLYVAYIDDPDPSSATFWLPELARAIRQPTRYGFPTNLIALCAFSAPAPNVHFSMPRSTDLFSLSFDVDSFPTIEARNGLELPLKAVVEELPFGGPSNRASALKQSALETFSDEDATALSAAFEVYLTSKCKAPEKADHSVPLIGALDAALKQLTTQENKAHA